MKITCGCWRPRQQPCVCLLAGSRNVRDRLPGGAEKKEQYRQRRPEELKTTEL